MKTVVLKNGNEEIENLVRITMTTIEGLHPVTLFELIEKCRDRNHEMFGNTTEELMSINLMQPDGYIHSSIANIVLSAIEGKDMVISSPIADKS